MIAPADAATGPPATGWRARVDAYERLLRLDKPIGVLLLLWPTLGALWLAAFGAPPWRLPSLTARRLRRHRGRRRARSP